MAKEQWWEQFKNPPKWIAPAYLVLAIVATGWLASDVVRGKDWYWSAVFTFFFGFHAWGNWYQRRKVTDSQELQPGNVQAKSDWWPYVSLILSIQVAFAVLVWAGIS